MRFSYAESMCDPSFYVPLAKAAEEAGYTSVTIPDSICYPEDSESKYPYNGTGDRAFLSDKPFIEPFSLIPALGAVTSTIRFTTFVVKLPIRSPVLVAKSVSSVAVLTNNRFVFGVGIVGSRSGVAVHGSSMAGDEPRECVGGARGGRGQQLGVGGFGRHACSARGDAAAIKRCGGPGRC